MSTTRAVPGRGALAVLALGLVLAAGAFLEFYSGVFTLLTLTGAVVFGVIAALRVLPPGPRIVVQALHRSAAIAAVGFLVTHVTLKIMEAHARPLDAIIPTGPHYVSLGTVSGDLLVLAAASGAVRGRYAASLRPWMWRTLHCTVYACWPIALVHGLLAGRAPKPYVTIGYLACVAAVIGVLLLRSATSRHEPPGSVPLPDLSALSEPRGGRAESRTAAFTAERDDADRAGRRTAGFTAEPDDARRTGPRTPSFADEPAWAADGPRTGPFPAADVPVAGPGAFTDRGWPPPEPPPRSTGPFRTAPAEPSWASGPFPAAPSEPYGTPGPASGPFPAAPSEPLRASGPFPAVDVPGAGPRAFADREWPPPEPPPPASIADLIGADPGTADRPRTPAPPAPPRIEDVLAEASAPPGHGAPPQGPAAPGFPPASGHGARTAPAPDGEPVARGSGPWPPGSATTGGFASASGPGPRTAPPVDGEPVARGPRTARPPGPEPDPEPRGRKSKKGRHKTMSEDEQDSAFWSSLRAERRDWTR